MSSSSSPRDTRGLRGKDKTEQHTRETGDRFGREHFLKPDSDQLDLDVLLESLNRVLDINDKLRKQQQQNNDRKLDEDCDSVSTTSSEKHKESRFLQEMLKPGSQQERHNFSFRNDQVFDIDRENQRLLKEITRCRPHSATTRNKKLQSTSHQPPRLKTSSEVNRRRFQQRIEQENQVLLRRIQAVKPDKSLQREHVMKSQVRLRPSSAPVRRGCSRPRSSRLGSSRPSITSSASTLDSSDHYCSTTDDNASQRSFSSAALKSSKKRFPKPTWEPGW